MEMEEVKNASALEELAPEFDNSRKFSKYVQGVFYTGPPLKSSKYKKVNLGKVRCI